jgi:predicted permease
MCELFRRFLYLLNRRRLDRELADEMEIHREMSLANGGDEDNFGNTLRLREEARDAWGWTWIDRTLQDVRYSFRTMRRTPGFTAAAVLMLAIGIGVNVAAFGFFNVVMFRPLPLRDPETLVRLHRLAPREYSSDVPYPAMEFYREHSRTLSAILALDVGQLTIKGAEKPVKAFFVTGNFFSELGARAAFGRLLDANDEDGRAEPVAVLGYDYWQTHFGADSSVVGTTIRLNRKPVMVIGVVANDFSGFTFSLPDVWLPIVRQPDIVEGSKLLTSFSADGDGVDMWGRLRPGVTAKAAEEELRGLTAELRTRRPNDIWENESLLITPGGYAQNAGGKERGSAPPPNLQSKLYPIFGLIGALALLILAVTCGNVGSLVLARGVSRQREIAIRTAVGASAGRLIRQLLTESLVLALAGSGAAVLLGSFVLQQMMVWTGAPAWLDVSPDWRVIAFTIGVAFAAAMLFGLTPALQLVRSFRRATRARQFLIGTQVAACCVLLVVAGLLARAIHHAITGNPGFEYKQVISVDPRLAIHGYSASAARAYLDRLQDRLRSLPGVRSVSLAVTPPLGNRRTTLGGEKDGRSFPIYLNRIDPDFFSTM